MVSSQGGYKANMVEGDLSRHEKEGQRQREEEEEKRERNAAAAAAAAAACKQVKTQLTFHALD